jgi:hypothetical protein
MKKKTRVKLRRLLADPDRHMAEIYSIGISLGVSRKEIDLLYSDPKTRLQFEANLTAKLKEQQGRDRLKAEMDKFIKQIESGEYPPKATS